MRHISFFTTILLVLCLSACNNSAKIPPKPFTASMLARQVFLINTETDTSLETLHGSVIRIAAGSFSATGPVEIEIREAFTPSEILAAGLTTESNGRPLKSGGMIYVNATANGDSVGLIKPIKVSIPNQVYDSAMQVYKGIASDSGTVNWVEPEPVDTTVQSQTWKKGKQLFAGRCASCHKVFSDLTGPALGNIEERWPVRSQLHQWIRDWNKAVYLKYPRAVEAMNYSPVEMQKFPNLTDSEIDAILFYLKNEYNDPAARAAEKAYLDSIYANKPPCKEDTLYIYERKNDESYFSDTIRTIPDTTATNNFPDTPRIRKAEELEGLRGGFADGIPTSGMYDFKIRTLGWYNIDAEVEGYEGTIIAQVNTELQMEIQGVDMNLYLFCPSNKTLSVSNDYKNNAYFFNKINGGIPLFRGERAILFAFGSKDDKIYHGIREFTIQPAQTIKIPVKESTEKEIREALLSKQMEGIDLGVEKKELTIVRVPCGGEVLPADTTGKK